MTPSFGAGETMSLTGAEKLNDTGCWQAAAQCVARSFRAVYLTAFPLISRRVDRDTLPSSNLAVLGFFGYLELVPVRHRLL